MNCYKYVKNIIRLEINKMLRLNGFNSVTFSSPPLILKRAKTFRLMPDRRLLKRAQLTITILHNKWPSNDERLVTIHPMILEAAPYQSGPSKRSIPINNGTIIENSAHIQPITLNYRNEACAGYELIKPVTHSRRRHPSYMLGRLTFAPFRRLTVPY